MRKQLKSANRDRLVVLSDDQLDHVSGGWGPGFGVLTAQRLTQNVTLNFTRVFPLSGVTVGQGQDTAFTAIPPS
jgi:hypothetical protein